MKPLSAFLLATLCLIASAQAQTKPPRFGQSVRSPEVDSSRRVTFRFKAPNAKSVIVYGEALGRIQMTLGDNGVWSGTTQPLEPDFYDYNFFVDGVSIPDPANALNKPAATGGAESIVHVPGPPTLSWEAGDVPHGILHTVTYQSKVLGEERSFVVYTPPNFDPAGKASYPVLYLLHGVMDDENSWTIAGRANVILDNAIARHQAKPMIAVMPLGYGFDQVPDRVGELFSFASN